MRALLDFLAHPMAMLGLIGQACFFSRFLVQWVASERQKRSVVPTAFWYFSLIGGLLVLIYALWRRDPVFILGQSVGLVVYTRGTNSSYGLSFLIEEKVAGSVPPRISHQALQRFGDASEFGCRMPDHGA